MSHTCTLHILHTNDIHSRFERMAQIATCLKQRRSKWEGRGEHVLTVDIGDHTDRMQDKTEATWGHANVRVLNESGYQYVTIGNNEGLTFPKARLDRLYEEADFTVVLSNLLDSASGTLPKWAVPYAIHEWDGFRVAILGVTVAFAEFYRELGWEAKEPLPLVKEQVARLRPQVDAIVVLSHLGYQADVDMAREIPEIDVILGAHTHRLLEKGERVGRTLVAQVGKYGEYIGHVRLRLDKAMRRVVESEAEVYRSKTYPADPALAQLIGRETAEADRILSRPVVRLSRDFEIDWDRETPFGSFLAAGLRRWTGADVGLANGGLLLTPLRQGQITRKDLLDCVPHPVKPCLVTLRGDQLWRILERAAVPDVVRMPLRGFGFRGEVTGWMGIDGMIVYYDQTSVPVIRRVEIGGEPLEWNREYRVGTVDMFLFNRLFPEFQQALGQRFFLNDLLREMFAHMLGDDELVEASFTPRWLAASERKG